MKKRFLKISLSFALALGMISGIATPAFADESDSDKGINEKLGVPIVVYGETLSESQLE